GPLAINIATAADSIAVQLGALGDIYKVSVAAGSIEDSWIVSYTGNSASLAPALTITSTEASATARIGSATGQVVTGLTGSGTQSDPWVVQLTAVPGSQSFNATDKDAITGIENLDLTTARMLPRDAVFVTRDGAKQTITINPEGTAVPGGTWDLFVD